MHHERKDSRTVIKTNSNKKKKERKKETKNKRTKMLTAAGKGKAG